MSRILDEIFGKLLAHREDLELTCKQIVLV